MTPRISSFTTGGGVVHRLTLAAYPGRKFSAWYDEFGIVYDAEGMPAAGGAPRPVSLKQVEMLQRAVDALLGFPAKTGE